MYCTSKNANAASSVVSALQNSLAQRDFISLREKERERGFAFVSGFGLDFASPPHIRAKYHPFLYGEYSLQKNTEKGINESLLAPDTVPSAISNPTQYELEIGQLHQRLLGPRPRSKCTQSKCMGMWYSRYSMHLFLESDRMCMAEDVIYILWLYSYVYFTYSTVQRIVHIGYLHHTHPRCSSIYVCV